MKTSLDQNHYEFLGIEPDASTNEVRRAVAKLREMFAPGAIALYSLVDQEEHRAFLERLEEAAVVLGDERARAAYDERHGLGRKAPEPPKKARPGPAEQLQLADIVGAVDEAPAWPKATEPVAAAKPVEAPAARTEAKPVEAPAVDATAVPGAPEEIGGAEAAADLGIEVDVEEPEDAPAPAADAATSLAIVRPPAPPKPAVPAAPLPPMPELGPTTTYTGELLRQIREARGLSLRDVATRTRISLGHLDHLEAEAFGQLPERVYLRGILVAYARELKVDGARLAETYLARWAAARRE